MQKSDVVRLLVGCGFRIRTVDPKPNYHLFKVDRTELLGTTIRLNIAVAGSSFVAADTAALVAGAKRDSAALVLVGECGEAPFDVSVLTAEQFEHRLGGAILSLLPISPEYAEHLSKLGGNVLPPGLQGDASDAFERYVHAGLQFILRTRVVRYGQERRYEKVADGISIGDGAPLVLYDAKAYADGYDVNADSVRQFASYVNEFHKRYEARVGRIASFLVFSGKFKNGIASMRNKSRDLRVATGGVNLCFISASAFAAVVDCMVKQPLLRSSLDWNAVFAHDELNAGIVTAEIEARLRDKIVTA